MSSTMGKLTAAAPVPVGTVEPPAPCARPSGNGQGQDIAASRRLGSGASPQSATGGPGEGHRCWPRQDNGCPPAAGAPLLRPGGGPAPHPPHPAGPAPVLPPPPLCPT